MQGTLSPRGGNISESVWILEIARPDRRRRRWYVFIAIWSNAACICSILRAPWLHETRAASDLTQKKVKRLFSQNENSAVYLVFSSFVVSDARSSDLCFCPVTQQKLGGFQLQRIKYLTRLLYQIKSSWDTFVICCWLNLDYYFLWMSIKWDIAVLQVYNLLNVDFWGCYIWRAGRGVTAHLWLRCFSAVPKGWNNKKLHWIMIFLYQEWVSDKFTDMSLGHHNWSYTLNLRGVFTPVVRLLWSESGTNLLQCCILPRVWFVFTRQHLQVDQNVWCAKKLLSDLNFENDAAVQLNLAPSRQEVTHWNNNNVTSG